MDQDQARQSAIAKATRRLIPFLCLCYAVNCLDRVNVGFAALAMNEDFGFTPSIFGAGVELHGFWGLKGLAVAVHRRRPAGGAASA